MSEENCVVCLDGFNKSTRSKTECPYCHTKICRTCLQTYLLNDISDVPRCVNIECGNGWERTFLDGEFTRSFRLSIYKDHREKVLSDRERAQLPATQEDAAQYRNSVVIYNTSTEEVQKLNAQIAELQRQVNRLESRRYDAKQVYDSHGRLRLRTEGNQLEIVRPERATEVAAFVKPCPAPDCKGFLSTAWKCGLCNLYSCPDCHELKGESRDVEHTCEPDKVATARLLSRDSKNCPKCGVSITRVSGCDQMFCTQCHTSFNWRTGKIADGPVHNPHYFEWLRSQGRDPLAAPAVGGVGNCDTDLDMRVARALAPDNPYVVANPYNYYVRRARPAGSRNPDIEYLIEAWRLMREGQDVNNRELDLTERFRVLRVRYLVDDLTETDWKTALQRAEKDANFQRAVREVRDVYVGAVRDIIRQVLNADHDKKAIRRQVEELVSYCNKSYAEVGTRFGRKVPQIMIKVEAPPIMAAD